MQNHGEEISLRIRTDDLKGFRKYESIKKTLLHELVSLPHNNFAVLVLSDLCKKAGVRELALFYALCITNSACLPVGWGLLGTAIGEPQNQTWSWTVAAINGPWTCIGPGQASTSNFDQDHFY